MYKQRFVQTAVALVIVMLIGSLQIVAAQNETAVNDTDTDLNETDMNVTVDDTDSDLNETDADNETTLEVTTTVVNSTNASDMNDTEDSEENSVTNAALIDSETNTDVGVATGIGNNVATNGGSANVNNNVNNNVNTVTVNTNSVQQVGLLQSVNDRLGDIRILIAALLGNTLDNNATNVTNMTNMTNVTNTTTNNTNMTNSTNTTVVNMTNTTTVINGTSVTDDDAIAVAIDRGVGWVLDGDNSFARFAGLEHSFVNANETLWQGDVQHGVALVLFDERTYRVIMDANASDEDTKVYTVEGNSALGTLTLEKRFDMGIFETWVGALNTGNESYGLGFAMIHREFAIEVEPDRGARVDIDNATIDANNPNFQQELEVIASASFNG